MITEVYGYRSYYLYAEDQGEIVGILPLVHVKGFFFDSRLVSLPFTTYGGIVADSPATRRELFEAGSNLARSLKASYVELRHFEVESMKLPTRTHKVSMRLDLPSSAETLWMEFRSEVRKGIRKGKKKGFSVRIGGMEEMDSFYKVFCKNMRDLGTPAYSSRFFYSLFEQWPYTKWVVTVYLRHQVVAGAILLGFRDVVEMPWNASLREMNSLCPNMLLYWRCLMHAIDQGFLTFDFGRCSPDSGTFRFKKQWGARPVPLFWQYWLAHANASLPNLGPGNPKFAYGIRLWQWLPLWLTRLLGPHLVRFFP